MAERRSRRVPVEEEQFFELEYLGRKGLRCGIGSVNASTDTDGVEDVTLDIAGEIFAKTLPVKIGDLPESSALRGKRRPHMAENGKECTLELENSIPFGEEPSIARKIRMEEGLMACTLDIRMRASCRVKTLSAGGLAISGALRKVLFPGSGLPDVDFEGLEEGAVFYDAPELPLLAVFETKKSCLAFAPGDDLWRWYSAEKFNGKSRFVMCKQDGKVRFLWEIFSLDPGIEELPDGRNIRLTYLLSWKLKRAEKLKKYKFRDSFNMASADFQESFCRKNADGRVEQTGCFACQGTENILKKYVRSLLENAEEGDRFAVTNVSPGVCWNASHLERAKAKNLAHRDLTALMDFRAWARRQLARKGATLELVAVEDSPLKGWMNLL
ncbi:MAG: hypothetical protein IKA79_07965 [Lentisphaeria bacterium]|nr:hypothetical protein [Lentisphaeria bacterium]